MVTTKTDQIRQDCRDKALHCLGTSYVFQKKAERLEKLSRLISLLGVIVPLLIGGVATTYGFNTQILKWAIWIVAPISLFQLLLSGISLVNKWDSQLSYALESQSENRILSEQYQKLTKFPPSTEVELEKQFDVLSAKDSERTKQDEKVNFSDKENRMGMRYGLMILQRQCVSCKEIPLYMTPTECLVCGKF